LQISRVRLCCGHCHGSGAGRAGEIAGKACRHRSLEQRARGGDHQGQPPQCRDRRVSVPCMPGECPGTGMGHPGKAPQGHQRRGDQRRQCAQLGQQQGQLGVESRDLITAGPADVKVRATAGGAWCSKGRGPESGGSPRRFPAGRASRLAGKVQSRAAQEKRLPLVMQDVNWAGRQGTGTGRPWWRCWKASAIAAGSGREVGHQLVVLGSLFLPLRIGAWMTG